MKEMKWYCAECGGTDLTEEWGIMVEIGRGFPEQPSEWEFYKTGDHFCNACEAPCDIYGETD